METQTKKHSPETLPLEKLPYVQSAKEQAATYQNLIDRLNKRRTLLSESKEKESEYEENERHINLIKTNMELARTHTLLIKKNTHIEEVKNSLSEVLNEIEVKWNELMAKARLQKDVNSQIGEAMAKLDMVAFEENYELKVQFYLTIKSLIYPPKKETKKQSKR